MTPWVVSAVNVGARSPSFRAMTDSSLLDLSAFNLVPFCLVPCALCLLLSGCRFSGNLLERAPSKVRLAVLAQERGGGDLRGDCTPRLIAPRPAIGCSSRSAPRGRSAAM